ncbi:hypothetical protein PSD17_25660 [Pseudonocardia sp. D17]|nr:hypothetical protein PSD17_25660 [Pseudonocardia sp. D17]
MASHDGYAEIERFMDLLIERIDAMREINSSPEIEERFIGQMLISRLHEISELSKNAAMLIAIDAVRKSDITKRNAADRLRIHPHTLDRAIRRFEEEYETRQGHPLDIEVLNKMP